MVMDFSVPRVLFLTTSIQLSFDTDGHITRLDPPGDQGIDADHILLIPQIQAQQNHMEGIGEISLFYTLPISKDLSVPELYDGTQDLHGKRILILMLNGWGDMILIEPAIKALYSKVASTGRPPGITLGCNWIKNFPYPDAGYIEKVIPNIITFAQLCSFDILISLLPINHQRTATRSICDLCLDIFHLDPGSLAKGTPSVGPNPSRLSRLRPVFVRLRRITGKKILFLNWRSRVHHKDASAALFAQIAEILKEEYQSIVIKDHGTAAIMQEEIDNLKAPVMNLSHLIHDYHDTVAALSLVDAFISVDTGIVHAAGAMGIPGVALFGPFPPETHVADYPSVVPVRAGFQGTICDGPCLETHRGCAEVGYSADLVSPCFDSIDADDLLHALKIATKETGRDYGASFLNRAVITYRGREIKNGRH